MGVAPTIIRLDLLATGNSADGQIYRNFVDDAFGALSSKLLILLRVDTINVASTSILDALGNTITAKSTATKTANDLNFNNKPSITLANPTNNPYTTIAGNIGIGAAPQPMTNSFTVLAGLRPPSGTGNILGVYGDNAGTSDSANKSGFYLTPNTANTVLNLWGGVGNATMTGKRH